MKETKECREARLGANREDKLEEYQGLYGVSATLRKMRQDTYGMPWCLPSGVRGALAEVIRQVDVAERKLHDRIRELEEELFR